MSPGTLYAVRMDGTPPVESPRTFWDRRRWDRARQVYVAEPLSERFPTYVKVFALGCGAILVGAMVIFALSSLRLEHAVGFTAIFTGATLLLFGGARGGGYTNIAVGAAGALVGGRNAMDDDPSDDAELRRGNVMKRRDPMERLRRGLRPAPNPSAFWTTIAGFLYIAMGVPFTL